MTETPQPLDKHDENTDSNKEQADALSAGGGIGADV